MKISSFFHLVEIRTKIASMIPLALGTLYTVLFYGKFNFTNFIFLFISLFCFDMLTTALNNYYDYKKSIKKTGYNYEEHNAIKSDNLNIKLVLLILLVLFIIAVSSGVLLFLNTNIIILLIGVMSFAVGILYSSGPIPISRTPFGEIFSGLFMGGMILFLSVYIHIFDLNPIAYSLKDYLFVLTINWPLLLSIGVFSISSITCIANIMLANNICDMKDDLINLRYTLPVYLGKTKSLILFVLLYGSAFLSILIMPFFKIISFVYLFSLLGFIPVIKNIILFLKNQSKKDTFKLSVINFLILGGAQVFILLILTVMKYLLKISV